MVTPAIDQKSQQALSADSLDRVAKLTAEINRERREAEGLFYFSLTVTGSAFMYYSKD